MILQLKALVYLRAFLYIIFMRVYIIKSGKEYEASITEPDPDTAQVMYMLEKMTKIMELPKDEVDDYILAWAEEIKQVLR